MRALKNESRFSPWTMVLASAVLNLGCSAGGSAATATTGEGEEVPSSTVEERSGDELDGPGPPALIIAPEGVVLPDEPSDSDVPEVCAAQTSEAIVSKLPMDIILTIDNSGSMTKEIEAVERNVHENFARILEASGIDYRLILVSFYEPWVSEADSRFLGVCIENPLGPSGCENRAPGESPHGERFFHVHQRINSQDAFCALVDSATALDIDDVVVEEGWLSLLREDSFKSFLSIGDDSVKLRAGRSDFLCSSSEPRLAPDLAAAKFDEWLLGFSPEHFGSSSARNYSWHSIVGVQEKADPTETYGPREPLVMNTCSTAEDPGAPRQELSLLTGGLRFPVCHVESYDSVFRAIAESVVERSSLPCTWEVPVPPEGQRFDADLLNLEYFPSGAANSETLANVANRAACDGVQGNAWYYDDPESPAQVFACPSSCEALQADESGKVELKLGCPTVKAPPVR